LGMPRPRLCRVPTPFRVSCGRATISARANAA
jgi:hypothetical protein